MGNWWDSGNSSTTLSGQCRRVRSNGSLVIPTRLRGRSHFEENGHAQASWHRLHRAESRQSGPESGGKLLVFAWLCFALPCLALLPLLLLLLPLLLRLLLLLLTTAI